MPIAAHALTFPKSDGSRVPYEVFHSPEVYALEQERIFRGRTWNFLGLEAEIVSPGDFKSTFVGDTPVVMTRNEDGSLSAWVNRCAHRGAKVCRLARGNATSHACVYHQWSYDTRGNLEGVPFRRGSRGMEGMPADFDMAANGLQTLRVESYRGLVFTTFAAGMPSVADYVGPVMQGYLDRIFHKAIVYLGCTRQYSRSNWKLYLENVKDPYHASLLHMFHTTFNIFRVGMVARCVSDESGLHSIVYALSQENMSDPEQYKAQNIRSFDAEFGLRDPSVLALVKEYDEVTSNHIQPIFPQLVVQQIHNTLVARQLLPKGPSNFELIFHFFGYEDDTPEMRALRIKQANLVGPSGYISMEDTEATELVQRGTVGSGERGSTLQMARGAPETGDSTISETLIRKFWRGYQTMMGFAVEPEIAVAA